MSGLSATSCVRGETISRIGTSLEADGAEVIDASGKYVYSRIY